jgi:hypothetical protein
MDDWQPVSPNLVIIRVALAGVPLFALAEANTLSVPQARVLTLQLFCYAPAGIAWRIDAASRRAGQWAVSIMLAALVLLGSNWLQLPALLVLMLVPVHQAFYDLAVGVLRAGEPPFRGGAGPQRGVAADDRGSCARQPPACAGQ